MRLKSETARRLGAIALTLALGAGAAFGALGGGAGCGSDGVTPVCSLPDGAFNPESGCGQLVEAAAPLEDAAGEAAVGPVDSGGDVLPGLDASDAGDAGTGAGVDASDGGSHEAGDGGEGGAITDAHHDAAG